MEAAMKLARQYFLELSPQQPARTKYIARKESYHGTTLGSLSMSGHVARRALYEPMLLNNVSRVSACNAYRGMSDGEDVDSYVARLAQELDDEFVRLGPETVCAFVAEPVVGAVSQVFLPNTIKSDRGGVDPLQICSLIFNFPRLQPISATERFDWI